MKQTWEKHKQVVSTPFSKVIYSPRNITGIPGLKIDTNPTNAKPSDNFEVDCCLRGKNGESRENLRTGIKIKSTDNSYNSKKTSGEVADIFIGNSQKNDTKITTKEFIDRLNMNDDYETMDRLEFWIKHGLD